VPCAAVGAVGTPVNAGLAKGALRARALLIVVLKFGSLLIAAAISFNVSNVLGAPLISVVIAALTKAVFAICVLFVPCEAVGAVGVPVNAGLAKGALRASALLIVSLNFGSLLMAAAISFSVSIVPGAPLISAFIAA